MVQESQLILRSGYIRETLVYDYKVKGLNEELTEIQHQYGDLVHSSMHIHLDEENCLEIVAVKGEAQVIRDLVQELNTKKGVKQVKIAIVTP